LNISRIKFKPDTETEIGQKKISCGLIKKGHTVLCCFNTEASINGYKKILDRIKEKLNTETRLSIPWCPLGTSVDGIGIIFKDCNKQYVLMHPLAVAHSREVIRLNRGKTDPKSKNKKSSQFLSR
jgi:hypothetical protein